jgi:hypothetical protein
MENELGIAFRFIDIQVMMKHVREPPKEGITGLFQFEVRVETRVMPEKGFVVPVVEVKIRDGDNPEPLANFIVACVFHVKDFDKHIPLTEDKIHIIPEPFDKITKPVVISTARGIIYSELRGTYLNKAIMPIMHMDQFKEVDNDSQKELTIMEE